MNGKGEEMVKIIFGLIGIVIILAEILNIISTQRLWTKKITLWLAVYCFSAYVLWGDVIFLLIFMGCSTILIKYYYTLQKVSGRIIELEYTKLEDDLFCFFSLQEFPNIKFWTIKEVADPLQLRVYDEVAFWAEKIENGHFKIRTFTKIAVYIRHISDILRKKHIYEDHALRIQETGKYYKIKWL